MSREDQQQWFQSAFQQQQQQQFQLNRHMNERKNRNAQRRKKQRQTPMRRRLTPSEDVTSPGAASSNVYFVASSQYPQNQSSFVHSMFNSSNGSMSNQNSGVYSLNSG